MFDENGNYIKLIEIKEIQSDGSASSIWKLPEDFPINTKFKIVEEVSKIQTHSIFKVSAVGKHDPIHRSFFLKDEEGKFLRESSKADIFDLPNSFVNIRNSNLSKYLTFQKQFRDKFTFLYNTYAEYLGKIQFEYRKYDKGNLLLSYLNSNPNINTSDFYLLLQDLDKTLDIRSAKRVMYYWRYLGYLDFKFYGGDISVNKSSLYYLQTDRGIKSYFTGFRSEDIIVGLVRKCKDLGLKLISEEHLTPNHKILPQKIIIYDPYAINLNKIEKLSCEFRLTNNEPLIIYQIGAFYYQMGVSEFIDHLPTREIYSLKHHRKLCFDIDNLMWVETTSDVEDSELPLLIKYDGFLDRSVKYVFLFKGVRYILTDYSIAVFYLLATKGKKLLYAVINPGFETLDLCIPFQLPFPYWIEKGLILSNAHIPHKRKIFGQNYRVYAKIPKNIIKLISEKLGQKTEVINS